MSHEIDSLPGCVGLSWLGKRDRGIPAHAMMNAMSRSKTSRSFALTLSLCALFACGSASGGGGGVSGSVSGTVLGQSLNVVDAVSFVGVGVGSAGQSTVQTTVVLAGFGGVCGDVTNRTFPNGNTLDFNFAGGPLMPGTFTLSSVNSTTAAVVAFGDFNEFTGGSCDSFGGLGVSGGTVTISKADETGVAGTFNVALGTSGDSLSGAFNADRCTTAMPDAAQCI
jgi:hypothetical protein